MPAIPAPIGAGVSGCPGREKTLGAVEMLPVPSDRKDFDPPAFLLELAPKLPVAWPQQWSGLRVDIPCLIRCVSPFIESPSMH